MIPVTYAYVRVSKSDRDEKNLDTQLMLMERHGVRQEHIFRDVQTGRTFRRDGWESLMARVQPGDTIVVCWQDRFSRNFEEGVAIQADLTSRGIWIVSTEEGIDTRDGSAGAAFYRRIMLAQGAYQVESSSERIRAGQQRARASGKSIGRTPKLSAAQVQECVRMLEEGKSYREIGRLFGVQGGTVKRSVEGQQGV